MISELPRPVHTNDSATICGEDSDSRVRELEIVIAEKTFEVVSLQGVVAEQEQRIEELVEEQENHAASGNRHLRAANLQADNDKLQEQVAEAEMLKAENDKLKLQLSATQTGERAAISSQKEALMQLAGIELKLALLESHMAEKDMELSQTKVLYNKLLVETALRPSDHFDIMNKDTVDDKKGNHDTSAASTLADSDTDSAQGSPELSTIQEEASSVAADSDARSDTMTMNASVEEYVPHTPPDSSRASEATFLQFETCTRTTQDTEVWATQQSVSTEGPLSHRAAHMSEPLSSNRTLPGPEQEANSERSRPFATSLPRVRSVSPMRIVAPTRDSNGVPLERPRGRLDIANVVRGLTPPPCVADVRAASPIFGNAQAASPVRTIPTSPLRAASPMRSAMSEVRLASPMRRVQTVGALPAAQGRTLWTEIRAASPVGSRADIHAASPASTQPDVRAVSPVGSRADIRAASPAVTRSLADIRTASFVRDPRAASPVRTDMPGGNRAASPSLAASSSMTWKLPKPLWTEIRAASPVSSRGLRASTPVTSRTDLRATSPGAAHLEQRTASPVAMRTPWSEMRTASPSLRTDARAASPGINWNLPALWAEVSAASPARSPGPTGHQCSSPLRTPPMRAASPARATSPMRAVSAMSPLRPTIAAPANKAFDFPVTSALFPEQASPQGRGDYLPEKSPRNFLGQTDRSPSSQSWHFGALDRSNSYLLQPNYASFKISP